MSKSSLEDPKPLDISEKSNEEKTDAVSDQSSQELSPPPPAEAPPYHVFSKSKKIFIVSLATAAQLSSLLTISIYFPAIPTISTDLGVSVSDINLTITVYMIFQGVAPVISGSLSDRFGRRPVYVVSLLVYLISNIALAEQRTFVGVLLLRILQSAGCSALPILASAVVADMIPPSERGSYVGITGIPQVVGPSLSPILGGALVEAWGWQSIFWFLTCFAAIQLIIVITVLPETCRAIVKDGSYPPPLLNMSLLQFMTRKKSSVEETEKGQSDSPGQDDRPEPKPLNLARVFIEPFKVLMEPPALVLALYSSIFYAAQYSVTTSLSPETEKLFGFTPIEQGLIFLPMGAGGLAAWAVGAFIIDRNFARYKRKEAGVTTTADAHAKPDFPYERARLDVGIPIYLLGCLVVIAYGWILQERPSIPAICVLLVVLGLAAAAGSNSILILMSDTHRGRQAAASASLNLVKCPMGAVATATVNIVINRVGLGWTFTIFGGVSAVCILMIVWDWRYGTAYRLKKLGK